MEAAKSFEHSQEGGVRDFYREVFGWDRAIFDEDIKSWIIYSENQGIPPRILTRYDNIASILRSNRKDSDSPKRIANFEVTNIKNYYPKIEQSGGKIFAHGPADPKGISEYAACEDELGYHFNLVELNNPNYDEQAVAEIIEQHS